jgi:hypothetical protein
LPQYKPDKCIGACKGVQSPSHLFFSCYHYKEEQKKLKKELKELFAEKVIITLEIYIEKARQMVLWLSKKNYIATRNWLLELERKEEEGEREIE